MNLGNASWGFRETPLEEQLRITSDMGLDLLEIGIGGHPNDVIQPDATDDTIDKVNKLFARYGIRLLCASTGNDFTAESRAACMQEVEKVIPVIDIASKLGIANLRIFAGFAAAKTVVGARWDTMIDCLSRCITHAASKGVSAAIETHGRVEHKPEGVRHIDSTTSKPALLKQMLKELPAETRLVFDPGNLGAVGLDESQIINLYREVKPRIAYMHLKDFRTNASGLFSPCACGEGDLDWRILMEAFSDYNGPGMIEYENVEDIEDGLRRSLITIGK